jgi:CarD family transcriptional regulator
MRARMRQQRPDTPVLAPTAGGPRQGDAEGPAHRDKENCAGEELDFAVGQTVVSPHHGVGTVVERSVRELAGIRREYLTIEVERHSIRLLIPTDATAGAGLRPPASAAELSRALQTLAEEPQPISQSWQDRRKDALRKLGSGDVRLLAELVRDLAHVGATRPLAVNDRDAYTQARELLEDELSAGLDMHRRQAAAELDRELPRAARPLG